MNKEETRSIRQILYDSVDNECYSRIVRMGTFLDSKFDDTWMKHWGC